MFITLVFAILCLFISIFNSEPKLLTEIKNRYKKGIDILRQSGDPLWLPVLKPTILTGMYGKKDGVIGSNVNKGYEIYICLDGGDVNSAMYVLIHELAHMSVPEYDHTDHFWANFLKLKELCINNGLYTVSGTRTYCGDTIKDEGKSDH